MTRFAMNEAVAIPSAGILCLSVLAIAGDAQYNGRGENRTARAQTALARW
jgi:hypothetical protein